MPHPLLAIEIATGADQFIAQASSQAGRRPLDSRSAVIRALGFNTDNRRGRRDNIDADHLKLRGHRNLFANELIPDRNS